jgi:hypothetical protein
MDEDIWKTVRVRQRTTYRSGALNIALLFGTAAIALSLIITPMLADNGDARRLAHVQEEFDRMLPIRSIIPSAGAFFRKRRVRCASSNPTIPTPVADNPSHEETERPSGSPI